MIHQKTLCLKQAQGGLIKICLLCIIILLRYQEGNILVNSHRLILILNQTNRFLFLPLIIQRLTFFAGLAEEKNVNNLPPEFSWKELRLPDKKKTSWRLE